MLRFRNRLACAVVDTWRERVLRQRRAEGIARRCILRVQNVMIVQPDRVHAGATAPETSGRGLRFENPEPARGGRRPLGASKSFRGNGPMRLHGAAWRGYQPRPVGGAVSVGGAGGRPSTAGRWGRRWWCGCGTAGGRRADDVVRGGETEKADARGREAVYCAHPERSPGDGGLGMAGAAAGEEAEEATARRCLGRILHGLLAALVSTWVERTAERRHAARRAEGGPEASESAGAAVVLTWREQVAWRKRGTALRSGASPGYRTVPWS